MVTLGMGCLFVSSAMSVWSCHKVYRDATASYKMTTTLGIILLARIIQGFGSAFLQTGALGMVLEECSRADDATTEDAFASIVTANAFGAAVGPCIGGILYTVKGPESVFLAFVLCIGSAGILIAFFVDFPEGNLPVVAYEGHLKNKALFTTGLGFSVTYCCMSLLWSTFPVHLHQVWHVKQAVVGLIFTLVLLSHDIFLPIIYTFLEVKSSEARGTYVACAFGMLGSFTMLSFMARSWFAVCAMLFAFAFSSALAMSCCSTELAERSSQNLANYHLKDAAVQLGCAVGPLLGVAVNSASLFSTGPWHIALLCFGYIAMYYRQVACVTIKDI